MGISFRGFWGSRLKCQVQMSRALHRWCCLLPATSPQEEPRPRRPLLVCRRQMSALEAVCPDTPTEKLCFPSCEQQTGCGVMIRHPVNVSSPSDLHLMISEVGDHHLNQWFHQGLQKPTGSWFWFYLSYKFCWQWWTPFPCGGFPSGKEYMFKNLFFLLWKNSNSVSRSSCFYTMQIIFPRKISIHF